MKTRIVLFILAFLFWLSLSWSTDPRHIMTGIVVGVFVSFITADVFDKPPAILRNFWKYLWFLWYIVVFLWECVKANIESAYKIIHPNVPISPGIVKVRTALRSDSGLTFLANSLTLKPGTMTVDVDKQNGFLYIHWADVKSQDIDKATALIVGRFERILKRIFE